MPGRKYVSGNGYRYGFQNQEKVDEITVSAYDFGARIYDARLGKFFSVDPQATRIVWQSTYCFADNNPSRLIDYNGESTQPLPVKLSLKDIASTSDDYKPLTTQTLIALGYKNGLGTYKPPYKPTLDVRRIGLVFQDAVLNSLGQNENYKNFPCVGCSKDRRPDAVRAARGREILPNGMSGPSTFEFKESVFTEVKFKSTVTDEDTWNAGQIVDMIKALGQMKGGKKNGVYDPNLKPSSVGMATLVLVTPSNTTITDEVILNAAKANNVNIWQRTVEQSTTDENTIRVSSGVSIIYHASATPGMTTAVVPTTLIRKAGDDAKLKWPIKLFNK